jgi:outer membrane protein
MRIVRALCLAVLAAGGGQPAFAAGAAGAAPGGFLSLDEVVARALADSPGARDIAAGVELAGLDLERARADYRFRPYAFLNTDARSGADTGSTFRAGVSRRFASGSRWTLGASNTTFGDSYLSEVAVGYTLPIFQNPLTSGRFALDDAELGFRTRELQAVLAAEDLVLQAITAYYELALAENSIEVAEGATALAERLARATEIRLRAGRSSQLDRQLAELRVAESRQREAAAAAARAAARNRLAALLGYGHDDPFAVDPEIPVATDSDTALLEEEPLVELALRERRDFLALQADSELAARKVAARMPRLPGIDVTLQYALVGEGTSFSESSNLNDGRLGVGIAVDLAGKGSQAEESRRSLLQYQSRRRALDRLEADIRNDVQSSLFGVRDAAARLRLARQTRVLAQQQLRLAENLYAKGTGTTEDMLERQQGLLDARQGELGARAQLLLANYRLQAATGRLLDQWQP